MWAERFYQEGFYTDSDYMEAVRKTRVSLSKLIDCNWNDIAFFQSTAGAISQIAFGLCLNKDDEVLLWDQEYSSNLYPWKAACDQTGAKLIQVPSEKNFATPNEKLLSRVSKHTRVIAISWVQFQTGARVDLQSLGEYCANNQIFLCVDVMQGLGVHPFSMRNWKIDAVCGGSHKWLVSPVGVGFLALAPKWQNEISPLIIGSATYGACDDPSDLLCEPKKDALKYEAGSKQVLEITALGASVDLILECRIEILEQEAIRLGELLRQGLSGLGCQIHSPFSGQSVSSSIVNFTPPPGVSLDSALESFRKNEVNFAVRGPGIRLSPHAFNAEKDLEKALKAIESAR